MLCSAFYGMEDHWNYREEYNIPKDFLLIGDSGGFEQLTQGVRIEPIDVLKWQENNVDIALTLDVPPADPSNWALTPDNVFFGKCAEASQRNAEIALRNRKDLKLYYVVQGYSFEQLDKWSNNNLLEYDGVALSFKAPINAEKSMCLVNQAMYVKEKGVKNIHILTGTGFNIVPIIVYLKKYFDKVTFDSSSYGMGARNMQYNLPHRYKLFFGRAYNNKVKTLPCDCPVCKAVSIADFQTGTSISGALLSLHNLYNYIQHVNFLDAIVEDEELFTHYVKHHTNEKTQKAFDFLKSCEEIGFNDSYTKFFPDKHARFMEMF